MVWAKYSVFKALDPLAIREYLGPIWGLCRDCMGIKWGL